MPGRSNDYSHAAAPAAGAAYLSARTEMADRSKQIKIKRGYLWGPKKSHGSAFRPLQLPLTPTPTPDFSLFCLPAFALPLSAYIKKKENMLTRTHACTTSAGIPTVRLGITEAEQKIVHF